MKYVTDRPFATPEARRASCWKSYWQKDIDVGQYAYTGATNTAFLQADGDVTE
jgi:hypothetical protein